MRSTLEEIHENESIPVFYLFILLLKIDAKYFHVSFYFLNFDWVGILSWCLKFFLPWQVWTIWYIPKNIWSAARCRSFLCWEKEVCAITLYLCLYRLMPLLVFDKLFLSFRQKCNISTIMLEMDRMLRPGGRVYIRDTTLVIGELQEIATALGWSTTINDVGEGPYSSWKILRSDKRFWIAQLRQ